MSLIDRRLDIGVVQLLDEVDRLASSEPEGCGGVSEIVEADERGEASVVEGDVVSRSASIEVVQHQSSRLPNDQLHDVVVVDDEHCGKRSGLRRFVCNARQMAGTQAIYYRDKRGVEPVDEFIESLPTKRMAKIDDYVEEHLNGQEEDSPPPEFPISSQIEASCAS